MKYSGETRRFFLSNAGRAALTGLTFPHLRAADDIRIIDHRSLIQRTVIYRGKPPMELSVMAILRRLPEGRLMCIWVSGGHREPLNENLPLVSYSRDKGQTWTPPGTFANIPGKMTFCTEIESNEDRVIAHLFYGNAADRYRKVKNFRVVSSDGGQTWGEPEHYSIAANGAVLSQRVKLADGTMLYPFFTNEKNYKSAVWMHPPGRDTPTVSEFVKLEGMDLLTPRVVELASGRLVMLMHRGSQGGTRGLGRMWRAESADGGCTWSDPYPTDIPNSMTRFWFRKLSDGRYALVDNPTPAAPDGHHGRRDPLSLWISDDELKSWPLRVILDRGKYYPNPPKGPGRRFPFMLAYPEAVELDGKLHVAYDFNRRDVVFLTVDLQKIG